MLSLLPNPSPASDELATPAPIADTAPDELSSVSKPALCAAPTRPSVWRRIGAGTFGGGMLGLIGLLSGFLVPVVTLCLRVAHGPTQNYDATGGIPFTELIELFVALFAGLGQGAVGLLVGLIVGFAVTAMGNPETRPRRMVVAMLGLCALALMSALYFASTIVTTPPSA